MPLKYKVVRVRKETHRKAKREAKARGQSLIAYFADLVNEDLTYYGTKKGAK